MNKFKVGDKVVCLPGFTEDDEGDNRGGCGYKSGKVFEIREINSYDKLYPVAWPKDGNSGVYIQAIKLFNEQPNYEIY